MTSPTVSRVVGKLRRGVVRVPVVRQLDELRYQARRGRHSDAIGPLEAGGHSVLDGLRANGLVRHRFSEELPDPAKAQATRFVERLRAVDRPSVTGTSARIGPDEQLDDPTLYLWGLSEAHLAVAEHYFGLPVRYLGLEVKREFANGEVGDVRQFHLDIEDRRMMKMIVYLSDVTPSCGPFEYLDRADTEAAVDGLSYWSGFVADGRMAAVIPRTRWQSLLGPTYSGVYVDTCRLFHRATPPSTTDRYSMTFSYCSTTPFQVFPEFLQVAERVAGLADQMSRRQRQAVGVR